MSSLTAVFDKIKTNRSRLEYFYQNDTLLSSIKSAVDGIKASHQKSRLEAAKLRETGNNYYKKKLLPEALNNYCQASTIRSCPLCWRRNKRQCLIRIVYLTVAFGGYSALLALLLSLLARSLRQFRRQNSEFLPGRTCACLILDFLFRSFSQAITVAPHEDNELAKCFANRSAVFFELQRFADCVEDIDAALENGYDRRQWAKLLLRKAKCLSHLKRLTAGDVKEAEKLAKLSINKDKENDFMEAIKKLSAKLNQSAVITSSEDASQCAASECSMSDALVICYSEDCGRFIKARKHIAMYDIVLREDPFVSFLYPENFECFCERCMAVLDNKHFPCRGCSQIAFCSKSCADKAWLEYHQFECGYLDYIIGDGSTSRLKLILLVGLEKAIAAFKDSKSTSDTTHTSLAYEYKSKYDQVLSLVDHQDKIDGNSALKQCISAIGLTFLLVERNLINDDLDEKMIIGELLMKHMQQLQFNSIGIYKRLERKLENLQSASHMSKNHCVNDEEKIGSGLYPLTSLLNHSCNSNLIDEERGRRVSFRASRDINVGEEVSISYGPQLQTMPKSIRQKFLSTHYHFNCNCAVCQNDKNEIATSLKCCHCEQSVVFDAEALVSKCTNCERAFRDLKGSLDAIAKTQTQLDKATALIDTNNFVVAELQQVLHGCERTFEKYLYKFNYKFLQLYSSFRKFYLAQSNNELTISYLMKNAEVVKALYGEQSYEYVVNLMMLFDLKFDQFMDDKKALDKLGSQLAAKTIELYAAHVKESSQSYEIRKHELEKLRMMLKIMKGEVTLPPVAKSLRYQQN